ncbi:MAG: ATP-binding protein [Planctomycetota bacterium]|nr:ATP-binding protein [Planctomycetota bacterium]
MDTVVKKDIATQIAARLGRDPNEAESFLDAAIDVIQEELIRGRDVALKDFASIRLVERKARMVKDPVTGKQFVQPNRKVVSITPSRVFKERIEQARLSAILLAVPRDSSFVKVVQYHFSRVGWRVHVLHDPAEIWRAVKESGAYLLVADLSMEGGEDLVRDMKCDPETNTIPIVTLCPREMEPERPAGIRVLGDERLTEPFDIQELLRVAETLLSRTSEDQAFFSQQLAFVFSTDEECLEKANEMATALIQGRGLGEDGETALGAAFREAVGNAAQHGNRDNPGKVIRVDYYLDATRVTMVVSDEGGGFNHAYYTQRGEGGSALLAARERHRQGRVGGLGIMLMMRCADRLQYNDLGNSVTLTRNLGSQASAATSASSIG